MVTNEDLIINFFFAGSKSLQSERDMFYSNISKLQTKWKDKDSRVRIYGYSFANFDTDLVINGKQFTYNKFIKEQTDLIVFVLDGSIGGITKKEFKVAWNSFKKNKKPKIYVFSRLGGDSNKSIDLVKETINSINQYWDDYEYGQLRDKMLYVMSDFVQEKYDNYINPPINQNPNPSTVFVKVKGWVRKYILFIILSIISIFLLSFLFLIIKENQMENELKDECIVRMSLIRYGTLNKCFNNSFSNEKLDFFQYEDSLEDTILYIFPKSKYLTLNDGETDKSLTYPTDSIPFHFPVIKFTLIDNLKRPISVNKMSLIVTNFHTDDTPACRFFIKDNKLFIINETQTNITADLKYTPLHKGESFINFVRHLSQIKIHEAYIEDLSTDSIICNWNNRFIIKNNNPIKIDVNEEKSINLLSVNVNGNGEYKVNNIYDIDKENIVSLFREFNESKPDTSMCIALKANKSCEFYIRAKFISSDNKKKVYISKPVHIRIFVPRTGYQLINYKL